MGVDVCMYVKIRTASASEVEYGISGECSLVPVDSRFAPEGATHEVTQCWRYYGPGYERGPWPTIASVMLALFSCPEVETLWYFGDSHETSEPFTPQQFSDFCWHYIRNGNRPYFRETCIKDSKMEDRK